MSLGYDGDLYILAFDHRGSFRKRLGIGSDLTAEELARVKDAKHLVWEGFLTAIDDLPAGAGILVDEEYGADIAREARERGVVFAMPVERSGQDVFDFEFGDDWARHIEEFDPTFAKVLVRWHPDDDPDDKKTQALRLSKLGAWLHETGRKYLFELLVPASETDLAKVDGDTDRYDVELRPDLTRRAIREIRDMGIDPDVWKIEGLDRREDCESLSTLIRDEGRDGVIAVVLGRGADDAKVDHWLRTGAPVDGYHGLAIGRSIWGEPVDGFGAGQLDRARAAEAIGATYRRFIDVYQSAQDA